MRTALKIYRVESNKHSDLLDGIISAINEARKECIRECAKKAYKLWQDYNDCDPEDHILLLINELKQFTMLTFEQQENNRLLDTRLYEAESEHTRYQQELAAQRKAFYEMYPDHPIKSLFLPVHGRSQVIGLRCVEEE